jgi:hypothetical protein
VSRSKITFKDLETKKGTIVNGHQIQGSEYVLDQDRAEIQLGQCADLFRYANPCGAHLLSLGLMSRRIYWYPVVLSFSFTNKELQSDPLSKLADLERLDIKVLTEYNIPHTTHVVSKKRNTSKGLQALINGKYIVSDTFVERIRYAAEVVEDADRGEPSALEACFDVNWPDEMAYLPPRGGEPMDRPTSAYAPSSDRLEIFEGYTFVFYDKTQFDNLMAPITNGKGKALYSQVTPGETEVDDFVRFVKAEAGEKGLDSFEDGSEGKGVVVVRFVPSKGDQIEWYSRFFTHVSLRLDHRPIEQNEFLEAILNKDASILRRPLQIATTQDDLQDETPRGTAASSSVEIDQPEPTTQISIPASPLERKRRPRGPARRRFAGFDDGSDVNELSAPTIPGSIQSVAQDGLFVSQNMASPGPVMEEHQPARRATRKRPASPEPEEDDVMDDIAPTAAAAKRRRIEAGEEPVPREETAEPDTGDTAAQVAKSKKIKKEIDVLDVARKQREEMEARALAEKEDLALLPADVDLEEIRRLNIVEEMEVRQIPTTKIRGQDEADERWDARWNGRKNFKKFQQRGAPTGRPNRKVIVELDEVKKKEFGIGDDYWLEDESQRKEKGKEAQSPIIPEPQSQGKASSTRPARVVLSDNSEDEIRPDEPSVVMEDTPVALTRPRATRASQRAAQSQSIATRSQPTRQTQAKRPAPPPAKEQPAKKPRTTRKITQNKDSDESDDELKFRFGKRR